jgi:hypothetical protein
MSEPVNQGQLSAVIRISVKRGASLAWFVSESDNKLTGIARTRQRPTRSPETSPKKHYLLILLI